MKHIIFISLLLVWFLSCLEITASCSPDKPDVAKFCGYKIALWPLQTLRINTLSDDELWCVQVSMQGTFRHYQDCF